MDTSVYWHKGCLYSRRFSDVYFSREDGLAESRYVFLQQSDLPQRWRDGGVFTIFETGFGTGLNFLATCSQGGRAHIYLG